MAINYANLFGILGEHVERTNEFQALYTTVDTAETETIADYVTAGRYDLLAPLPEMFKGFKGSILSMIQQVNAKASIALTDRELVLVNLPVGSSSDVNQVLKALFNDMVTETETIEESVVTVGSVTADTANASAGTLLTTKVLDGVTPPITGGQANPGYKGLDSEVSYDDTVVVKCISDSESNGVSEGSEVFQWYGLPQPVSGQFSWYSAGSGTSVSVPCLNSYSYFSNLDFETFTNTNTPSSWTLDSGTAGTHIYAEASTHYRGDKAIKFTGDGATATLKISQDPSSGVSLVPGKRYCLAGYVKGTASTLAGTLTIQFEGTGYSAGSGEKIEMDYTALSAQTTWGLESCFINMPDEIPDDFELVIKITGTLTNAKSVWLDGLAFGPAIYENGVGVAIVAGADKFLKEDTFTFTIANNDAGVFQTWFRKMFLFQLPSDASPSIADTLAT